MGKCMSSQKKTEEEDADPAALEQRRVKLLYGVELPEKAFATFSDSSDGATSYSISVDLGQGMCVERTVWHEECALLLKLRLHEQPPDGIMVPPPSLSHMRMGETELLNSETYRQHDVEEAATVTIRPTAKEALRIGFDPGRGWGQSLTVLWPQESMRAAFARTNLLRFCTIRWRVHGSTEPVNLDVLLSETGIQDGDCLIPCSENKVGQIHGMAGWYVDQAILAKANHDVLDTLGKPGGTDRGWFALGNDEYLVEIAYKWPMFRSKTQYSGASIWFGTDQSRWFKVEGSRDYEVNDSRRVRWKADDGNHITGFDKTGRQLTGIKQEAI